MKTFPIPQHWKPRDAITYFEFLHHDGPVPEGVETISGGGSWLDRAAITRLVAEHLRKRS